MPVLGAYLHGENVHDFSFPNEGILVIGSEANGIAKSDVKKSITDKLNIPSYGQAESLNAAIATGIICDNIDALSKNT